MSDRDPFSTAAYAYCTPGFVEHHLLAKGHSSDTPNGTITFIRFEGRHYACTCAHVVRSAQEGEVVTIHCGRAVFPAGRFVAPGKYVSTFSLPTDAALDIALARIDGPPWTKLVADKQKKAIDLDSHAAPDWSTFEYFGAAGFPTGMKKDQSGNVAATMAFAVAEMSSTASSSRRWFTLRSELKEPHDIHFSGMSGGPIFGIGSDQSLTPVGITIEGMPSSPEAPPSIMAGPNVILIRGLVLSPAIFQEWLNLMP